MVKIPSVEEYESILERVEEYLRRIDVETEPTLRPKAVRELVNKYLGLYIEGNSKRSANPVKKQPLTDPIRDFVNQGLVTPEVVGGERDSFLYSREHVRDFIALNILRLRGYSYANMAAMLLRRCHIEIDSLTSRSGKNTSLPSEGERALLTLRSRLAGYLLKWLLGQQAVEGTLLHIMKRAAHIPLPEHETRIIVQRVTPKDLMSLPGQIKHDRELIGRVIVAGEVLLRNPDIRELSRFPYYQWFQITVERGNHTHSQLITVGYPTSDDSPSRLQIPTEPGRKTAMAMLVDAMLVEPFPGRKDERNSRDSLADTAIQSGYLSDLVDIVPELSDLWDYAAVFVPTNDTSTRELALQAVSHTFPPKIPLMVRLENGRPLVGWAFHNGLPITVNRPVQAVMAHHSLENAWAACAVPTRASGRSNGALYIATHSKPPGEQSIVFDEASILVLSLIGDVIGEIIERNQIRLDAESSSLLTMGQPEKYDRKWSEFRREVTEILKGVESAEAIDDLDDNLHIVAVKIQTSDKLRRSDPDLATWLDQHLQDTTYRFYLQCGFGAPRFFQRYSDRGSEFACVLPSLKISDADDRAFRDELRRLLRSVVLRISFDQSVTASSFVWSLPFRRTLLRKQVQSGEMDPETRAGDIFRETEEALLVLEYIEQAHEYEKEGQYRQALGSYQTASKIAQSNTYLMRHVAKTYMALGDSESLESSIAWWEQLINNSPVTSQHYFRLAQAQALLGRFSEAEKNFSIALKEDPSNDRALLAFGDLFLVQGNFEHAEELYLECLKKDLGSRDHVWLRLAEASHWSRESALAIDYALDVFARDPDNDQAQHALLLYRNAFYP